MMIKRNVLGVIAAALCVVPTHGFSQVAQSYPQQQQQWGQQSANFGYPPDNQYNNNHYADPRYARNDDYARRSTLPGTYGGNGSLEREPVRLTDEEGRLFRTASAARTSHVTEDTRRADNNAWPGAVPPRASSYPRGMPGEEPMDYLPEQMPQQQYLPPQGAAYPRSMPQAQDVMMNQKSVDRWTGSTPNTRYHPSSPYNYRFGNQLEQQQQMGYANQQYQPAGYYNNNNNGFSNYYHDRSHDQGYYNNQMRPDNYVYDNRNTGAATRPYNQWMGNRQDNSYSRGGYNNAYSPRSYPGNDNRQFLPPPPAGYPEQYYSQSHRFGRQQPQIQMDFRQTPYGQAYASSQSWKAPLSPHDNETRKSRLDWSF